MDTSKALTIIPRERIEWMVTATEDEIVDFLMAGPGILGAERLLELEKEAKRSIDRRYPDNPRDPCNVNGVHRFLQHLKITNVFRDAVNSVPIALADGVRRVREAEIDKRVAEAEFPAYTAQRRLTRVRSADEAAMAAETLLAKNEEHQTYMATAEGQQKHDRRMKKLENIVPIEITRLKSRAEVQVAELKAYAEAQTAHWRGMIATLTAEEDKVKLAALFADYLKASDLIDREREVHSPLFVQDTDPATGEATLRMNTDEARRRSQAKHDTMLRIVDRWQGTIGKGR